MMRGRNRGSWAVVDRLPWDSVGVELGVWKGDTSARFLASARVRLLHLVDAWSVEPYRGDNWTTYLARYADVGGPDFGDTYERVFQSVRQRFGGLLVEIHRMTSAAFFASRPAGWRCDWVYIDASHEELDVMADLKSSWAVADRIFGDDYGNKPGVTAAVDAFARSNGARVDVFGGNQFELVRASKQS